MPKVFHYRGQTLEQLQQLPMDDFIILLPSKARRKLTRGLPIEHRKLLESIRELKKNGKIETATVKTHCRGMVILPEMVGVTIATYNGKEFTPITIKSEMIGYLLGEFSITNKKVSHGQPGVGASRSSMYVPLK